MSETEFERLFSPVTINGVELMNRVVLAPLHDNMIGMDGYVNIRYEEYYMRMAKGGAGMIVLGAAASRPGLTTPHLDLYDDRYIPKLKEFMGKIHSETDSKVSVQLAEPLGDRKSIPKTEDFSIDDIKQMVQNMATAARRCKEADVDMVEIHGCHSLSVAMFLSRHNNRKDEYGGTVQRRIQMVRDLYTAMRKEVGEDYPIGIRYNADEFIVGGNTLRQTRIITKELCEMGWDWLSLTVGGKYQDTPDIKPIHGRIIYIGGYSALRMCPESYMPDATNVYLSADLRKVVRENGYTTPVTTAGKIPTPKLAEEILRDEKADLIGLCRALIRDPEWPNKAREGRVKEIKGCEYCNECTSRVPPGLPVYCKHDPWINKEY
jgi:2,4-dienoyl-CoA reductase-like NADH-dependent reductase (Old Yellow Enzyme family)